VPPGIALVVFVIGIAGLFFLDRDRERRSSPALWLPVIWLCIAGSRMVSQWLYPTPSNQPADAYLDGSPLDRVLLTALLAAALLVLAGRGARLGALLRANGPIICFFLYCGVSTLWSDYPDVAFKRWMKAVGDLAMVMVVLTSPDPLAALKRVVSRTAFLLIPLSVLLIKYYPELGRGYNQWNWGSFYVGVATEKNGLGYICLILGLGSLWRLTTMHDTAEIAGRRNQRIAHGVVLAMAMWLFWKADSVTALLCFFLGTSLLLLASVP
jgi:exopolysaccharide production protein ExoQ